MQSYNLLTLLLYEKRPLSILFEVVLLDMPESKH